MKTLNTYIYFIEAKDLGCVKIGITGNPRKRMMKLQSGCPHRLILRAAVIGDPNVEKRLHKRFASRRLEGEWFKLDDEIEYFIDLALNGSVRLFGNDYEESLYS